MGCRLQLELLLRAMDSYPSDSDNDDDDEEERMKSVVVHVSKGEQQLLLDFVKRQSHEHPAFIRDGWLDPIQIQKLLVNASHTKRDHQLEERGIGFHRNGARDSEGEEMGSRSDEHVSNDDDEITDHTDTRNGYKESGDDDSGNDHEFDKMT